MEQYKKEFIDFIIECGALKFGNFTLKSGRQSPFFFNTGSFVSGGQLERIGEFYARAILDNFGDDIDVLFGPAYKGIPLAVTASIAYSKLTGRDVCYSSNRKEIKDHGDAGILLGYQIKDGDRIVIVEDVITSGKSIEEIYPLLKIQGNTKVVGEIVSLDRQEKAKTDTNKSALASIGEKFDFLARAIVSMTEIIEVLNENVTSPDLKKRIDDYYKKWGSI